MIKVRNLNAFYGASQILFDVSLDVGSGSVTTLLGRNGMGKSTTVRSVMGMMGKKSGEIAINGVDVQHLRSHQIARFGIGLVPEGRRIFPNLSVRENLVATASNRRKTEDPWTIERIADMFPNLAARFDNAGWQLSGGEQQMLAIGRALMTNPQLLILDEATEGLSPLLREQIWKCLTMLKSLGQTILVIDKNIQRLLQFADHHVILEKGRVVWAGNSDVLRQSAAVRHKYLGV